MVSTRINIEPKDRIFWVICQPEGGSIYVPMWDATGYTRFHAWENFWGLETEIAGEEVLEFKKRKQGEGYIAVKMKGVLA